METRDNPVLCGSKVMKFSWFKIPRENDVCRVFYISFQSSFFEAMFVSRQPFTVVSKLPFLLFDFLGDH